MKKLFSLFTFGLILSSFLVFPQPSEAVSYGNYWDYYRDYYANKYGASRSSYTPRYSSRRSTSRYVRPTYRTRTTNYNRSYTPTTSNRYSNRRTNNYSNYLYGRRNQASSPVIRATSNPITLRQDVNEISSTPIDLFNIGLHYPRVSSTQLYPAALVREMTFRIVDNSGVVSEFDDFELVVEDQAFQFNRNGYITLDFQNLRLAQSESRELNVQIKVEDPDVFPRLPGSFRVKLEKVWATDENATQQIPVQISGRSISDYVVLNPRVGTSGGGSVSAQLTPRKVYGRTLSAGEKEVVFSAVLGANRDDFLVEKITVTNSFGSNIDSLTDEIRLINQNTGQVLSSRKFIGGSAVFDLGRNDILIPRNKEVALAFELAVRNTLPQGVTDNRIELNMSPSDVEIFGIGSGKVVPDSSKFFNTDNETFTIAQGGGGMGGITFSAGQPAFVSTGDLNEMARFTISNAGSGSISVGRISVQSFLSGVEFPGGLSTDDVELREIYQGREAPSTSFVTTGASGNILTFDASSEIYIEGNSSREFTIKMALDNLTSGDDEADSVTFKILGDTSFNKGTLSSVRSSGANFVWSDHSGRPHNTGSSDWLSGFLVRGLPTGNYVKYRR